MSGARNGMIALALLVLGLSVSGGVAHAQDGTGIIIDAHDEVLRIGHIYPLHIRRQVASAHFQDGPWLLQVEIDQGDQQLANSAMTVATLGQLRNGIQLDLVPNAAKASPEPARISVVLTDPQRRIVERIHLEVPTPQGLQRAMLGSYQRLVHSHPSQQNPGDLLPFLWAEQAQELCDGDISLLSCIRLRDLTGLIDAWVAGTRPRLRLDDTNLLALRDAVDGSVQPYRLTVPAHTDGPVPVPVVLVCATTGPEITKVGWPQLTAGWLRAARAAGVAVVEGYPAGDCGWRDVAPRRALLARATAQALVPWLRPDRTILLGIGTGAPGAIRLAEENPERFAALALIDPICAPLPDGLTDHPLPEDHGDHADQAEALAHWMALREPGARPTHLIGLPVIVQGSSDAVCARWLRAARQAGVPVTTTEHSALTTAFWSTLASQTRRDFPSDFVVVQPGLIAQCQVDAMTQWGQPGFLHIDRTTPPRVSAQGIAYLRPIIPEIRDASTYAHDLPPLSAIAKRFGQALGPLAAYAEAPFVLVIGSGEDAAACSDNRALADAFMKQWARHAQGQLPAFLDSQFPQQDYMTYHLILIGTTRSNSLLQTLVQDDEHFPLHWTARELIYAGQHFARSERRAVALAWPHPARDGRMLVVLDGAPGWPLPDAVGDSITNARVSSTLPLAGLPDLVIGGETPSAPVVVWKVFDNQWK